MLKCKPAEKLFIQKHKFGDYPDQVPTDKGRRMWLQTIAYAVSVVNHFMHTPSKSHMEAIMQILRYVKSSPG